MNAEEQRRAKFRAQQRARRRKARRKHQIALAAILLGCVLVVGLTATMLVKAIAQKVSAPVPEDEVAAEVVEVETETEPYVIVLDSGHSTYNAGAHGIVNEEDITAATTEYLRLLLEADENYTAILTHEYDVYIGIAARRQVGIDNEADFFISIHCNINEDDSSITGFEVYPQLPESANYEASYQVASYIAEAFIAAGHTPRASTGIFYCRYVTDDNGNDVQYTLTEYDESVTDYGGETYGVIKSDEYPGILVEQGYVNSQTDVDNWMSEAGMQKAAQIYYEALCDYFGTVPVSCDDVW